MKTALIIDDDRNILTTLEIHLEELGFMVHTARSGAEGLERYGAVRPELVLLDLKLPDRFGLEVLQEMARHDIKSCIIVVTAYATIETAVKAVKMGAFDYLAKPFTPAQITRVLEMARRVHALESEVRELKGIVQEGGLITRNRRMRKILRTARQIADATATVLLTGESGTGKGLLARLIHDWSPRAQFPFVTVDCAGLQENLLESDLFGHRKGAFTGAVADKRGKLEIAHLGTAFLDEISEMTGAIQAKMLRFMQNKEFERLGDPASIQVDVRIIAATNRDLEEQVREQRFRQDLFFRLNVVELYLPALRDRPEDIQILAEHFLVRFARLNGKAVAGIRKDALQMLEGYSWPGNVRELLNVVERGTILCRGSEITPRELPAHIAEFNPHSIPGHELKSLAAVEKDHIQQVLTHTASMEEAARVLGIDPATLWRKRKKYHLD